MHKIHFDYNPTVQHTNSMQDTRFIVVFLVQCSVTSQALTVAPYGREASLKNIGKCIFE